MNAEQCVITEYMSDATGTQLFPLAIDATEVLSREPAPTYHIEKNLTLEGSGR
jgi:hypothetical protein